MMGLLCAFVVLIQVRYVFSLTLDIRARNVIMRINASAKVIEIHNLNEIVNFDIELANNWPLLSISLTLHTFF